MKRKYREYKGIKIECQMTQNGFDSDYYNVMYLFRLNGGLRVAHKLKDAKSKIDKYTTKVA